MEYPTAKPDLGLSFLTFALFRLDNSLLLGSGAVLYIMYIVASTH